MQNRIYTVHNAFSRQNIYRWCKKRKLISVDENTFSKILISINEELIDSLLKGNDIKLPLRLGTIELRKYDTFVKFNNGKLVTNKPVNWKATNHLWNTDDECKSNHTLVRYDTKELYKIYYNKSGTLYKNKELIKFFPNQKLKKRLKEKINSDSIDAFKF